VSDIPWALRTALRTPYLPVPIYLPIPDNNDVPHSSCPHLHARYAPSCAPSRRTCAFRITRCRYFTYPRPTPVLCSSRAHGTARACARGYHPSVSCGARRNMPTGDINLFCVAALRCAGLHAHTTRLTTAWMAGRLRSPLLQQPRAFISFTSSTGLPPPHTLPTTPP